MNQLPAPNEILSWNVVFYDHSPVWYGRIVPGRFKHVAIFQFSPQIDAWIFQEVIFSHMRTILIPGDDAGLLEIGKLIGECAVLKAPRGERSAVLMTGPLTCVGFARHALGLPWWCVSLTPDQLYRALIKQGAEVVSDGRRRGRLEQLGTVDAASDAATTPAATGRGR
jgi:hypothetical protein